jgi:two-component system, OmpR family, response regulator VicR
MGASTAASESSSHRILVVDDEVQIARCLRRLLERAGFEVAVAHCPLEALDRLDSFRPDLVLSDFRMPRMSGADLLAEVQRRIPVAIRVVASGYAELEAVQAGVEQGVICRVLKKPWDDRALVDEIRRLLLR